MAQAEIPIKNIYYMLTYAFKELRRNNYEQIAGEAFEEIHDLYAEILAMGISYLLKQGLHKEYVEKKDALPTLRGKLNLWGTIGERLAQRQRLVCEYDELTENNLFNQILKTTVGRLIRHAAVKRGSKQKLKQLMLFFEHVDEVDVSTIRWGALRYDRNSRTYQMLHSFCYFLLESMLLTTAQGEHKMLHFTDDHLNLLFQRFVMAYYCRHFPEFNARAKQIKWNFLEGEGLSSNFCLSCRQILH